MKIHKESSRGIRTAELIEILVGFIAGFSFFTVTSHQKSPIYKKLPEKKLKNISYFPNIKVKKEKGSYHHIHHWMILMALYTPFILIKRLRHKLIHGFLIGSIIQGLSYKDRFQIKYHSKTQLK